MTGSMYAAIAGLKAHMQNLNVIGNNVANVNTQGYKSARAVFKTSIYTTTSGGSNGSANIGGKNPAQIGYGANIGAIDIDMSSGNYSITGKTTDLMIDGDGFFLVGTKDLARNFTGGAGDVGTSGALTSLTLTRVGDFDFMPDGTLAKNDDGMCVYGFLCIGVATMKDVADGKAAKVGDPMFSDQLVPIRKPRVYTDEKGGMHIGYPRAGGGIVEEKAADATTGQEAVLADSRKDDFNKKIDGNDAALKDTHLLDYGSYVKKTGNTTEVVESDYEFASLESISFDQNTGIITAKCQETGQIITIGCIAVGNVANPNGVTQIGSSYYQAGQGAGSLTISTMGGGKDLGINYVNGSLAYAGGAGGTADGKTNMPVGADNAVDGARLRSSSSQLLSNGLEMSKTDLAQEIANMIVTQRGYQANTRIITVTDSMLEELVNMKR